ncbi:MAG: hypothetical protein GXY83_42035 [Rhodopirellula sp.]|nr:hypothetical protein [Rhodopirellula sp.]
MRVSIARCALVALTILSLCGCSSSGGSSGGFSWNPFQSKSADVAATPPKPSAFSTPASPTSSTTPEQIASKTSTSSPESSFPGAPTSYSATLDALTKAKQSNSATETINPSQSQALPQNGYYQPSSYAASAVSPGSHSDTAGSSYGSSPSYSATVPTSYAGSPLSSTTSSFGSSTNTGGWGASVSKETPSYAPAAERYANPLAYGVGASNSVANSGLTSSAGSPYAYTASNTPSYGSPTTGQAAPLSATAGHSSSGDSSQASASYASTVGSGLPPYASSQYSTGYQPGQTDYQPGSTGYQPGVNSYTPGNSGYSPAANGFNPTGGASYQSPAAPYQAPTTPYQTPGGSYSTPAAPYQSSAANVGPLGATATAGEYRPGSTKSLPTYESPITMADNQVTPAGYSAGSTSLR